MLVELTCGNEECPGFTDWTNRHTFLGSEVPATMTDPGYIEGSCNLCGQETMEWNVERLTKEDIEELKVQHLL